MTLLAGFFIGVAIGMFVFHYVVRKQQMSQFSKKHQFYLHQIARQMEEIHFRHAHLNKYRFMEYNLSEILVVQPQIIIP